MSTNTNTATLVHTTALVTGGKRDILAIATEPVTGTALLEATFAGKVAFHKVRENGTMRRWPVFAPKSAERKAAERVREQVEASSVPEVAKKTNTSVATVRRTLVSLSFTEALEAMSAKERAAIAKEATANAKVVAAKAPAKEATPAKAETPAKPAKAEPKKAEVKKVEPKAEPTVAELKAAGRTQEAAKAHAKAMRATADATVKGK